MSPTDKPERWICEWHGFAYTPCCQMAKRAKLVAMWVVDEDASQPAVPAPSPSILARLRARAHRLTRRG